MNISLVPAPQSLLGILATLPDPRRRQGRMYPLASILGLLVLAALNGERSLRGMWMWGCSHWPQIADGLGFWDVARPPTLSTVCYVLTRLDLDALDAVVHEWATPWLQTEPEGWSIDGKVVRGSKPADRAALRVVGFAAHTLQGVLRQHPVEAGDEVTAAVQLLRHVPLQGQVVTMDAGLLQRDVVQVILDGGGEYVGVLKGNHSDVKPLVDEWIADAVFSPRVPSSPGRTDARETARTD